MPGKCNTAADKASRIFHGQTEWKLYSHIYVSITQALEAPSIYLHLGLIFRLSLTKLGTLTLVPNMLFLLTRGNTISTLFLHSISLIGGRRWKLTKPRGYLLCHCRQHRHGFQFVVPPCSGTSHSSSRKESAPAAIKPYNPYAFHPLHHKWTLMACKSSGCLYKFQRLSEQVIDTVMSS